MSSFSSRTNRTCCICKKLFCCVECCKLHQKNKHPGQEFYCPLCYDEKFLLDFKLDDKLLCHVIVNHLPLHCYLCGDFFEQSKDFELAGACKFWLTRRSRLSTSERRSLLATPIPSRADNKRKEHSTIDGDYNGNFVGSLNSPPELYRTTSTPMHVAVTGKKSSSECKTPHMPNFFLKTPNVSSATSIKSYTSESKSSDYDGKSSTYMTCSSNQDKTPFRTLPSYSGMEGKLSAKSTSGMMHSIMTEQDESEYKTATKNEFSGCGSEVSADEMELTGVQGGILPETQNVEVRIHEKRRSGSLKKVRFSDQYESAIEPSRGSLGGFNMTENDEYHEARETLSESEEILIESKEIRMSRSTVTVEEVPLESEAGKTNASDEDRKRSDAESRSNSEESSENASSAEKENKRQQRSQSNVGVTQQTGCSRVVMMVVVENNSTIGSTDIGALIESGLKKLSSISNTAEYNQPETRRRSITTVNNSVSTTSFEFFPGVNSTAIPQHNADCPSFPNRENSTSLLSTVTHAVKQALRSFPGGNFLIPASKRDDIPSTSSSSRLSSFTSCLSSNSRKRSRDFKDDFPSPPSTPTDSAISYPDDKSPAAKRPRGWYKVKAREPIARMRNKLTSPRGISSETQIFSQGSLSVGNTIIPIPARAHQSTQSDSLADNSNS